jgi:hypothetical protein
MLSMLATHRLVACWAGIYIMVLDGQLCYRDQDKAVLVNGGETLALKYKDQAVTRKNLLDTQD